MINYRILALDPGGETGWDTYSAMKVPGLGKDGQAKFYEETWVGGTLSGKHHKRLDTLLGNQNVREYTIICERFVDRATGAHVELVSREYIGVTEAFCEESEVPLVMQMPAHAKGFVRDENLKKLGLWIPRHGGRHQRDARRHILYYMIHTLKRNDLLEKGWR